MLTKDEKKMLRVVATYNEISEERAEKAIVKEYLQLLMKEDTPISNMKLPVLPDEVMKAAEKLITPVVETPEQPKPRRKPGPKPKRKTVNEVAEEIEQTEREGKMSREEFVEYFSQRGEA